MYRDDLSDVGIWSGFLAILSFRLPVTAVILFLQTGSYIVFRLWEAGYISDWIDWGQVYNQSLVSLASIGEGRYYTLFSCYLFNLDFLHLAFDCLVLGAFLGAIEENLGSIVAAVLSILNMFLISGTFLLISKFLMVPLESLSPMMQEITLFFRSDALHYFGVWKVAPLWVMTALAGIVLLDVDALLWTIGGLALALLVELTWISDRGGIHHAWDTYVATGACGLLFGFVCYKIVDPV